MFTPSFAGLLLQWSGPFRAAGVARGSLPQGGGSFDELNKNAASLATEARKIMEKLGPTYVRARPSLRLRLPVEVTDGSAPRSFQATQEDALRSVEDTL